MYTDIEYSIKNHLLSAFNEKINSRSGQDLRVPYIIEDAQIRSKVTDHCQGGSDWRQKNIG